MSPSSGASSVVAAGIGQDKSLEAFFLSLWGRNQIKRCDATGTDFRRSKLRLETSFDVEYCGATKDSSISLCTNILPSFSGSKGIKSIQEKKDIFLVQNIKIPMISRFSRKFSKIIEKILILRSSCSFKNTLVIWITPKPWKIFYHTAIP